ncbi:hypothetical protein [Gluconobacter cerinus]|uniref:hypothetical protein n=1 Tax=Gluconobacter cerinus TaxID=38307 RepID=UPI001B8C52DA|nr:hypothetical protein [Gluconobacter cerinus]MBS0994727.1 hypothetical protein [Gluconobacter cerinus]
MTQNTEQNVRTREEIETELQRLFTHGIRGPNAAWQVVHRIFDEVRAYGAEEQRRKDGERQEPVVWIKQSELNYNWPSEAGVWRSCQLREFTIPLYTHPANVTALEARIAELTEAEQLARADAEASKARVEKLREALMAVSENTTDDCPGSFDRPYIEKLSWAVVWCRRKARAALTREGGV